MEPFIIRCPTCRSGLRVRRPEVIGEIIGCPKCSGMVLVTRPEEPAPVMNAASRQQTTLSDTQLKAPAEFESSCDKIDDLLESPAPSAGPSHANNGKRWRELPANRSMKNAFAFDSDFESDHAPGRTRRSKRRRRNALKKLFAVAAIGLIGFAGWYHFGRTGEVANSLPGNQENLNPPTIESSSIAGKTATDTTASIPLETDLAESTAVDPERVPDKSDEADSPANVALASHQSTTTDAPAIEPVDHTEPVAEEAAKPAAPQPVDNFSELFENAKKAKADITNVNLPNGTRPTSAARDQQPRVIKELELPQHLRVRFEPAEVKIHNDALPHKPVDVRARLQDPIEDVRIRVGLNEALQFVSSMSTIPFTLRPEALRYSRITPNAVTPIAEARTTVGNLLKKGIARHSLDIRVDDGHVIVDRKNAVSGQPITNSHNVADLTKAGVSGPELISLVKQLIDPFTWTAIESPAEIFMQDGLLVIRHNESVHFQTMFLLERFRVARGMSLMGSMDRKEFQDDWRRTAELTQPIALRTKRADSMGSVVQKLDQLAGNEHHVIADWKSLSEQGWTATSPLSAKVARQPLGTALPHLLEPLGLTHRCVGPKIIQITTRAKESQSWELGFHSIGALTQAGYDPQTVVRQVETTIGERVFRRGGGRAVIVYNDGAQSLLVRLPQSQQAAVDWVIKELERTL